MRLQFVRLIAPIAIATAAVTVSGQSVPMMNPPAKSSSTFEDAEIRVVIPKGWKVVSDAELKLPDGPGMFLGNSVSGAQGKLILEKEKYVLGIAYNTEHASGIEGGRFIEAFNIPWPGVDDPWDCSMYLHGQTQPASRVLIFDDIIVDEMDPRGIESCNLSKRPGDWGDRNGMKRRWYGGYFTTAAGGYFFDSKDEECGLKAYTLTFQEKIPERLPLLGDPSLLRMIREAVDVVNSIHYKKCAPAP